MLKLFCAIVGVAGSAFSVRVDERDSVDDLKDAIKAKKPNDFKDIDADKLQLFLAKTEGGAWLFDNEDLDTLLESEIDTSSYLHLRSSWKLCKRNLFGPGVSLGEDVVHVLVVVPYQQAQVDMFHEALSLAQQASVRQSRIEMRLEQLAASLPHKNSKSYSDGSLGQLLLERLKKDKMFFDLPPTDDGEAFWSADIQLQANAIRNEAAFDAFITPFFSTILRSCGLVFVKARDINGCPSLHL
ncbi:unnamed protein product [Phytophthora lilii]|uniref:Unnamed protein product n=1 Tax=Phytophthora lilii TaxID=2077276 RepID=A0A9W7D9N2_9STRA|nr:unnamed protein product [Phytophthora lilii]